MVIKLINIHTLYRFSSLVLLFFPVLVLAGVDPDLTPEDFDIPNQNFIVKLFNVLFKPRYFEPHWVHFIFDPALMWSMIVANILIFVAYTIIPIALAFFLIKRKEIFASKIIWLFGAFIVLCGLHHIVHVITFWYPIYHIQNIVDILTAVVSLATFFALLKVLPQAIKLKTPFELEVVNNKLIEKTKMLDQALTELKDTNIELTTRKNDLEAEVYRRTKELEESNLNLEAQVQVRTKNINKKVSELEKLNNVMVGREIKMIALKKEIEDLKKEKP